MNPRKFTRRQVIATASAGALGVMADWHIGNQPFGEFSADHHQVQK